MAYDVVLNHLEDGTVEWLTVELDDDEVTPWEDK